MDLQPYVIAAYSVTGLVAAWLIGASWWRARTVRRAPGANKKR